MQDKGMEVSASGYLKGLDDLEHDIKATEQTLLAIAQQAPGSKDSVHAAASSVLVLLRLKAHAEASPSLASQQLVRDSCTSLLTPQPGSALPGLQPQHHGLQSQQQQAAVLDTKLGKCCSVLTSAIDSATVSQLTAVLGALYARQLQLLSSRSEAAHPANVPEAQPATAVAVQTSTLQQLAGQGTIGNAVAASSGGTQLLPAQRPVAVSLPRRSLPDDAPNLASPGYLPCLAGPEDAPNLASPAPGALSGPLVAGPLPNLPRAASYSSGGGEAQLGFGEDGGDIEGREKGAGWAAARGAVEVDRHGRIAASASSQISRPIGASASGQCTSQKGPETALAREAALKLQLAEAEALCEEFAGRLAAVEQRCAEVDLLRGENLRQADALADLHRRLHTAEEEGSARAELLSQVNADQAELVEELSQQIEVLRAQQAAAAVAQLEGRAAEAGAAAAAAAEAAAAAQTRARELEQHVELLQEEVAAAAHLRRQVADQAAALAAADAELGQLREGADMAQDGHDRATAALHAQLEGQAAEIAELRDQNMALRVNAGQSRQLLALRTEALAQSEAQAELLRVAAIAGSTGAAPPPLPEAAGAGESAKEVARLRAALAVSEDQRRRDGAAHEAAVARLKAEVERIRTRRPRTAPPGPATPDRRSAPPARRGSASSGRSEGPLADPPVSTASHRPPQESPALDAAPAHLQHAWQDRADWASGTQEELDQAVRGHQAEIARWQEHCGALEQELGCLRALAAQHWLPEHALQLGSGQGTRGGRPEVFPLDRYLSASPPGGFALQSAPNQHPLSVQSARQQLAPPPPTFPPDLLSWEAAAQQQQLESAGCDGDSSISADSSERLADSDMDALLQSLEAAVLKSSPSQVFPEQHGSSSTAHEPIARGLQAIGCVPNQAEDLGSVRSDIVAALQRRNDLQEELRGTQAKIGAAQSELACTLSKVTEAQGALQSMHEEANRLARQVEDHRAELGRLEAQVQNGYTQMESLGAAAHFASIQHLPQISIGKEEDHDGPADSSQGVKLLLRKLKEANAIAERYKKDLHEARAASAAMQQQLAQRERAATAELAASEAGLREARQQLRLLEAQQPAASGSRSAKLWDDVIEEAAGELEGVEGQLHTASRQLLDMRSATAQLSADAQKASAAKEQAEREAAEAREQLTETLAEVSAARRDAARHRAAADAAEKERTRTEAERARLAGGIERLEGEVRCLNRQLEDAASSCQAQEQALLQLKQDRERAAVAAGAAEQSAEAAQQKLRNLQEEQLRGEAQMLETAANLNKLKLQHAEEEAELAELKKAAAAERQAAETDAARAAVALTALHEQIASLESKASAAQSHLVELQAETRTQSERVSGLHQQREEAARELQHLQSLQEAAAQHRRREAEAADAAAAEAAAAQRERSETRRSLQLAQEELATIQSQLQRQQNLPGSYSARRRLHLHASPDRDPFLSPVAPPSAAGGTHHRSAAVTDRSPHYAVGSAEASPYHARGYAAESGGTPHYLLGTRQEQQRFEEEARLRERLAESADQSASQADVIAGLMDEAQLLRRENEEMAAECEEMRGRLALGSAELADARRRAEAAVGELSRAEVRLRSAEAQKASLAAEVQSLKRLLKRAEDDRAGLTTECQGLTERLGAAASQREAYEHECEGLTEQLRAAEAARAVVPAAVVELTADLRAANERAASAGAALAAAQRSAQVATADISSARADAASANARLEEVEARLASAESERAELAARLAAAERQKGEAEERLAAGEKSRAELGHTLEAARAEADAETFSQLLAGLPAEAVRSPHGAPHDWHSTGERAAMQAQLASLKRHAANERAILSDLRARIQQSRAELDSAHAAKRQLSEVQRQLAELERDLCRGQHAARSWT